MVLLFVDDDVILHLRLMFFSTLPERQRNAMAQILDGRFKNSVV